MTEQRHERDMIAPWWHTTALVALIVCVSVTGLVLSRAGVSASAPPAAPRVATAYLPLFVVQCALLLYVSRVGRKRNALPWLIGRGWSTTGRAATDLAVAFWAAAFIEASELWFSHHAGAVRGASVAALLPHGVVEKSIWIVVAATVGFSEEVVYRGYLQAQLTAFTHRAALAIALQAALFGLAHGEQGPFAMARFAVYGVLLGSIASWRKSLVACIVTHVAIDVGSGLFR